MAKSKKEIFYWLSVVCYGVALIAVLLYLRFPTEKFHRFIEQYVERSLPGVACDIGEVGYSFPAGIVLDQVKLTQAGKKENALFEDPRMVLNPVLTSPLRRFQIKSSAYGGNHSGLVDLGQNEGNISLEEIQLVDLDLGGVGMLRKNLDRKITGNLHLTGNGVLTREPLGFISAMGKAQVKGGTYGLKKRILEQNEISLTESEVKITLKDGVVTFQEGKISNSKMNADFSGKITVADELLASEISLQGAIVPLAPIYKDKRQLKAIITRMQKRYKQSALPFTVRGTVTRPAFVFGN